MVKAEFVVFWVFALCSVVVACQIANPCHIKDELSGLRCSCLFVYRFDLHYYTCGGGHSLLSVDTRYNEDEMCGSAAGGKEPGQEDCNTVPPLEKLILTK